jgi:hypothetical protein
MSQYATRVPFPRVSCQTGDTVAHVLPFFFQLFRAVGNIGNIVSLTNALSNAVGVLHVQHPKASNMLHPCFSGFLAGALLPPTLILAPLPVRLITNQINCFDLQLCPDVLLSASRSLFAARMYSVLMASVTGHCLPAFCCLLFYIG